MASADPPLGSLRVHNPFDDNDDGGGGTGTGMDVKDGSNATFSEKGSEDRPAPQSSYGFGGGGGGGDDGGTVATSTTKSSGLTRWFREKAAPTLSEEGGGMLSSSQGNHSSTPGRRRRNTNAGPSSSSKSKVRTPVVQEWPYDDYHLEQRKYYARLHPSSEKSPSGSSRRRRRFPRPHRYASDTTDDHPHNDANEHDDDEELDDWENRRPPELPPISEAVRGLPLSEFPAAARDRAIGTVSTWLYDTGLVDELGLGMATDGPSSSQNSHNNNNNNSNNNNKWRGTTSTMTNYSSNPLRLEQEMARLRHATQRQLARTNGRLNDGVATSGAEVQGLVNAVLRTRAELLGLRTQSAATAKLAEKRREEFIFRNYPRLRSVTEARRNLGRCFNQLEFFRKIPAACDRLRDNMSSDEYSDDYWHNVRDVCAEHVELQRLLMEAEADMKTRRQKHRGKNGGDAYYGAGYDAIDKFLKEHVDNVWELGREIKGRVLLGIGESYDLALENPAGMVALCEAVEVYEKADKDFPKQQQQQQQQQPTNEILNDHNNPNEHRLRFTYLRADALRQIYKDFERRGVELFQEAIQNADISDDQAVFAAVIGGANQLVADIDTFKQRIGPCFPPHWSVDILWISCVSNVCAKQIFQEIGGLEGSDLQRLSVPRLLDLIAWIEYFRIHVSEAFPHVKITSDNNNNNKDDALDDTTLEALRVDQYADARPDLLVENDHNRQIEVDMETATNSVVWANRLLDRVYALAETEYLRGSGEQTRNFFNSIYQMTREVTFTADGRLVISSLCEDLFSMLNVQFQTVREHLSPGSTALVSAVSNIFDQLHSYQTLYRDQLVKNEDVDFDGCCAAANDFYRMLEKSDELLEELMDHTDLNEEAEEALRNSHGRLLTLYGSDAVYAAKWTHRFLFDEFEKDNVDDDDDDNGGEEGVALAKIFFSEEWLRRDHDPAAEMVSSIRGFVDEDLKLEEFLKGKAVEALVTASCTFYVKCLLVKADQHNSYREPAFSDVSGALERYASDLSVFRDCFDSLARDHELPTLTRTVDRELEVLNTLHEVMSIAAGLQQGDVGDFILVVHKEILDSESTGHLFGDLCHLVNPSIEKDVLETFENRKEEMEAISAMSSSVSSDAPRDEVEGLTLPSMLTRLYADSKRKLPNKSSYAAQQAHTYLQGLTTGLRTTTGH